MTFFDQEFLAQAEAQIAQILQEHGFSTDISLKVGESELLATSDPEKVVGTPLMVAGHQFYLGFPKESVQP
jgi:hypothetical protein